VSLTKNTQLRRVAARWLWLAGSSCASQLVATTTCTATAAAATDLMPPVVDVFCSSCRFALIRYNKSGRGALVKLNPARVRVDSATAAGAPLTCPQCGGAFAREVVIRGVLFRKLIGGKVVVKGGVGAR
jgi:RNase P subunit RPR2